MMQTLRYSSQDMQDLAPPPMSPAEAKALSAIIHQQSGITISPTRSDFLRSRLSKRLRLQGCRNFSEYLQKLAGARGETERQAMIEAMTTHTTGFFREGMHFDWMRSTGLAGLLGQESGRLRPLVIWSAACSIGAELWSAAMVAQQFGQRLGAGYRWQGVGTDISEVILRRARLGVFSDEEIAGIPEEMRTDFLLRARAPLPGSRVWPLFRISPALRAQVKFAQSNLLEPQTLPKIFADLVFLRNVLIYFSAKDQKLAIRAVVERIRPGGYLLMGHSDSVTCDEFGLRQITSSIFQRI